MSVIVPVHQGARVLPRCLSALRTSEMPDGSWELIVVDDASTDATALIAAEFADAIVRLPGRPRGPAYARNRGVELARGEVVVFVDADVCVHADTLRRFTVVFANEPEVSAVFGAYDTEPEARQFVSQYRNLLHHYLHVRSAGEAETFWGGCGAIRRHVFIEAGRYDEWSYPRPQIEDVELGHRVRLLGKRIVLRPEIQCTHLKRWTLRGVITGDFRDRGVPWTRMLIQNGLATKSQTLNLRTVEKLNTALICLALLLGTMSVVLRSQRAIVLALTGFVAVLILNRDLYSYFYRVRGLLFALGVIPLHTLYYINNALAVVYGWTLHHLFGEPSPDATTQAYAEVGVDMWPPVPTKKPEVGNH
jgi:cellulose synthase/poly-beta-1,6-N-acetylglucosamine synthase-like glycosyltransferase